MTKLSEPEAAPAKAKAKKTEAKIPKLPKIPGAGNFFGLFEEEPVNVDSLPDAEDATKHRLRMLKIVYAESILIIVLVGIFIIAMPIFRPIYLYHAVEPDGKQAMLVPLDMPNLTNQAVRSWATSSVTEIMTLGFGDFNQKLISQKPRFTKEGWEGFLKAFFNQNVGKRFEDYSLVLTTVPANTAVITAQGENPKGQYQWTIELPVIMTYATNNDVSQRAYVLVRLTIVRVPPEENSSGIAIQSWMSL